MSTVLKQRRTFCGVRYLCSGLGHSRCQSKPLALPVFGALDLLLVNPCGLARCSRSFTLPRVLSQRAATC